MIIFHCFSCFWASLGLIPWGIARYAPAVLHPNLLQNQLKTKKWTHLLFPDFGGFNISVTPTPLNPNL